MLSSLFSSGALRVDRSVKTVVAVDTTHGYVCASSASTTVRGGVGVEASGVLLAAYAACGDLILARGGWVAKFAANAPLRTRAKGSGRGGSDYCTRRGTDIPRTGGCADLPLENHSTHSLGWCLAFGAGGEPS